MYKAGGYCTGSTTPLVESIAYTSNNQPIRTLNYSYDLAGNITATNGVQYKYDAFGQLIRVNNLNDTTAGSSGTN